MIGRYHLNIIELESNTRNKKMKHRIKSEIFVSDYGSDDEPIHNEDGSIVFKTLICFYIGKKKYKKYLDIKICPENLLNSRWISLDSFVKVYVSLSSSLPSKILADTNRAESFSPA